MLKLGDLSKRVDSLVFLNEVVSSKYEEFKDQLKTKADMLVDSITYVIDDVFSKSLDELPVRFAKYFLTIVHKLCSLKGIMLHVSEDKLYLFGEQLLTRLLIEGLDKVGDKGEGETMIRNLNGTMLRLLENCAPTNIFCVLILLLRKYKGYTELPKLPGLIIKCLLKLTKILENIAHELNIERVCASSLIMLRCS